MSGIERLADTELRSSTNPLASILRKHELLREAMAKTQTDAKSDGIEIHFQARNAHRHSLAKPADLARIRGLFEKTAPEASALKAKQP